MSTYTDTAWQKLRGLVVDLGKDGGLISPSVYDTAQVLRLYPPKEGVEPGLDWLLEQQRTDGGWSTPDAPYTRTVPTLAALLTLHTYRKDRKTRIHIDAGLAFLEEHASIWADFQNIDLLPIAAEMILPYLIEEANRIGLAIDRQPYAKVYALRQKKCQQISKHELKPNTPPTYSWEALGKGVYSISPNQCGSIGNNPSATAAWLHQATSLPELAEKCAQAQQYLAKASAATGTNIPGVVPHAWPITGFELAYAPYALLVTNLLNHPQIQTVIPKPIQQLDLTMRQNHGIGFGGYFTPDLDDTAVGAAALHRATYKVDPQVILQFKNCDHFYTYYHEMNPSVLTNAHALYAMKTLNMHFPLVEEFLIKRQCSDGRWLSDKWHSSWLYTTLEVALALNLLGYSYEPMRAADILIKAQKSDGGWSCGLYSTQLETSYAVIALHTLHKSGLLNEPGTQALLRGFDWLRLHEAHYDSAEELLWLGKELYSPYRVDRIYALSAVLAVTQELEFV